MNRDAFLTRAEAAKVTGRNAATIGNWRARGWVTLDGEHRELTVRRRADGTLLYRLGDLLDAERDTSSNPKSRGAGHLAVARAAAAAGADTSELPRAGQMEPRFHCPPRLTTTVAA